MFSLLTAGALAIAMMLNLSAESSADSFSPSTQVTQALIVPATTAGQAIMAESTASIKAYESASRAPLLMSSPIPRLAIFAMLAALPLIAALLILISRWRLPISPPVDDDPARYLRRSLL